MPPSTIRVWPVVIPLKSLASHSMAPATSEGFSGLLAGAYRYHAGIWRLLS